MAASMFGGQVARNAYTLPFQQPRLTPVRVPASATRAPARSPVSQTLAQVANQRVNQQLAPQLAQQAAFGRQQNAVIQGFANALLGKLQPVAGQVGADYDTAIQQTGALSNQAAQYLQNANPTPQVQALLQAVNAPQAQQDQLASQLGQTFGGGAGVLAFTGGAIPGGQLAAEKAAAQAQAEQLPGLAALRGQQDLASALWQQGQDRMQINAQRPALYQQAAQDIRQNNAARAAAAATAFDRNRTYAEGVREYNQTRADKAAADQATAQRAARRDFLSFYNANKNTTLSEKQWTNIAKGFGVNITGLETTAPPPKTPAPKTVAPGSSLVDSTGKVLYTAPSKPTKPEDKMVKGVGIVRVNADGSTKVLYKTPAGASGSSQTFSKPLSIANGVITDTHNQPMLQGGKSVPYKVLPADRPSPDKVTWPNLTKAQVIHLRSGVANGYYGVKDEKGKEILKPLTYQENIQHAIQSGYSRAGATKMANRFYMPGQRGRPRKK